MDRDISMLNIQDHRLLMCLCNLSQCSHSLNDSKDAGVKACKFLRCTVNPKKYFQESHIYQLKTNTQRWCLVIVTHLFVGGTSFQQNDRARTASKYNSQEANLQDQLQSAIAFSSPTLTFHTFSFCSTVYRNSKPLHATAFPRSSPQKDMTKG